VLSKARETHKERITNVEFRLGEIEHCRVADNSIDVIISNCVINLSPEKQRVFDEPPVLQPGGRTLLLQTWSRPRHFPTTSNPIGLLHRCYGCASQVRIFSACSRRQVLRTSRIVPKDSSRSFIPEWLPGKRVEDYLSATIEAVKPGPALT